jgi:hypothetical protein
MQIDRKERTVHISQLRVLKNMDEWLSAAVPLSVHLGETTDHHHTYQKRPLVPLIQSSTVTLIPQQPLEGVVVVKKDDDDEEDDDDEKERGRLLLESELMKERPNLPDEFINDLNGNIVLVCLCITYTLHMFTCMCFLSKYSQHTHIQ